jgi:hypothetical protein
MQSEDRLARVGAPVFGARGVLTVPCPPTGAAQVSDAFSTYDKVRGSVIIGLDSWLFYV